MRVGPELIPYLRGAKLPREVPAFSLLSRVQTTPSPDPEVLIITFTLTLILILLLYY